MKKISVCFVALFCSLNFYSCDKKDYSNYTVACIGDSITWGYDYKTRGQLAEPYPTVLKKSLGFGHVSNHGVPSSTLSNGDKSYAPMVDRIRRIDSDANLVIVWGGVNDRDRGCPMGTKGDTDSSTVYGALDTMCAFLNNRYKDAFKMFITPLPAKWDGVMYYLNDVKEAIEYTCNNYKIPVLNMTDNSEFENEIQSGRTEGVHPSQSYINEKLVPKIKNFIKSNL